LKKNESETETGKLTTELNKYYFIFNCTNVADILRRDAVYTTQTDTALDICSILYVGVSHKMTV